jgi:hypothetical protein
VEHVINTHVQIYSENTRHILQKYYKSFSYTKKFFYRGKGVCVYRYFLKAALNFALLFLRIVTLGDKLPKILC